MLTNAEGWINVTKQDLQDLEKPDIILVRSVFESTASKVFMMLEVGFLPVRFVIMKKLLQFLHLILNESINSMIRQVYNVLKEDSRKGDFISLVIRKYLILTLHMKRLH